MLIQANDVAHFDLTYLCRLKHVHQVYCSHLAGFRRFARVFAFILGVCADLIEGFQPLRLNLKRQRAKRSLWSLERFAELIMHMQGLTKVRLIDELVFQIILRYAHSPLAIEGNSFLIGLVTFAPREELLIPSVQFVHAAVVLALWLFG